MNRNVSCLISPPLRYTWSLRASKRGPLVDANRRQTGEPANKLRGELAAAGAWIGWISIQAHSHTHSHTHAGRLTHNCSPRRLVSITCYRCAHVAHRCSPTNVPVGPTLLVEAGYDNALKNPAWIWNLSAFVTLVGSLTLASSLSFFPTNNKPQRNFLSLQQFPLYRHMLHLADNNKICLLSKPTGPIIRHATIALIAEPDRKHLLIVVAVVWLSEQPSHKLLHLHKIRKVSPNKWLWICKHFLFTL